MRILAAVALSVPVLFFQSPAMALTCTKAWEVCVSNMSQGKATLPPCHERRATCMQTGKWLHGFQGHYFYETAKKK